MARVALEIQESLRHNFGQLARPLESIRESHLLRRSLPRCSQSLASSKQLSHSKLLSTLTSEPSRLVRIEEWLEEKRNLSRTTKRLPCNRMG